jgi:2-succinyl-5-enolpyruvyl-6-hydroxy-3-cyclohexene-1-carboxylate synthase
MHIPNVNYLHAAVLLKQLAVSGARRVVISPGSRSTPLALTALSIPEFSIFTLTDERSAGFFALGLSKADRVPAILICTSGTAAANYYPAVIEAAQSCTPLIVLTADRPASLRHSGAPQTIDQTDLYSRYPRLFADLPAADLTLEHCRYLRALAAEAYAIAISTPAGPAHLNVPFDEPLAPVCEKEAAARTLWEQISLEIAAPRRVTDETRVPSDVVQRITQTIGNALCGLIVAGPESARTDEEAEAILRLGKHLGWPLLADVCSGLRFLSHPVLPYYDLFLREESLALTEADVVLAFGAHPTSAILNAYLDRHRSAHTIRIQPHGLGQDPQQRAREILVGDVAAVCRDLAAEVTAARDSLLFEPFRLAAARIAEVLSGPPLSASACEAEYVLAAIRALPHGARIVLANSLPIRYADALLAAEGKPHAIHAMRGANGIDGTISHAAGIAAAAHEPTLLVSGDLAFLHDLNGLMAAQRYAPDLTILLLNNNGGGIFHFLPVREHESKDAFERIHGTPHDLHLSAARDLFGVDWQRVQDPREIAEWVSNPAERARVIEVRLSREENHTHYTQFIKRLRKAVAS